MTNSLLEQIHQLVEPALSSAGYECVEVEYKREQTGWVCRVYIDRAEGAQARDPALPGRDASVFEAVEEAFFTSEEYLRAEPIDTFADLEEDSGAGLWSRLRGKR